jgi:hypothetical protein
MVYRILNKRFWVFIVNNNNLKLLKCLEKRKQDIRVNSNDSLEGLMQETYSDACLQITDSQIGINQLTLTLTPDGVDDITKIAKEKVNF